MKEQEIKDLLEKYFEGETSLQEEKAIAAYFQYSDVHPSVTQYKALFNFYDSERAIALNNKIKLPTQPLQAIKSNNPKTFSLRSSWLRAASIALLLAGGVAIFWKNPTNTVSNKPIAAHKKARVITFDENADPEKAFAEVKSALLMASGRMKEGTDPVNIGMSKVREATQLIKEQ